MQYENHDFCAKCGGKCCLRSGCDYFISDFKNFNIDYLDSFLKTGKVSIVSLLLFKNLPNGNLAVSPLLFMRSRNIERGEIDLLSLKTKCASLTENGCAYSVNERPSGGVHLIPHKDGYGHCKSDVDKLEEARKWLPYQKVLSRLVKRYTGLSVMEKLKEDVYNLICTLIMQDYHDVAYDELLEIKDMLPLLQRAFPEEFLKARRVSNIKNKIMH